MRQFFVTVALLAVPLSVAYSQLPRQNRQQAFPRSIPAGQYSGITSLGADIYAVVSDKGADGFHRLLIDIDTVSGRVIGVSYDGFVASGLPNRDAEAIAYNPHARTLFICGEADNQILEYTAAGVPTGRRLVLPAVYSRLQGNRGLESLCYDAETQRYYTVSECPAVGDSLLRLAAISDSGTVEAMYAYRLDNQKVKRNGTTVNGVSELCSIGDGRLLVLERTVRVPRRKIGAYVDCRLYEVRPEQAEHLAKRLVCRWRTRLGLFRRGFANYEGMCVAKRLADGRLIILLVADSQDRYRGVLRDWLKTVIIM